MNSFIKKLSTFLPFGYNVPSSLEECYTWQYAVSYIVKCLEELDERVTALEENNKENKNGE